jgi:quinol monooxygenase YgiN
MAAPVLPDIDSFSLHVTIFIAPDSVNEFLEAFKTIFDLVTAEEECIFFEMFQDPASPGTLSWVENWWVETQVLDLDG